MAEILIKDLDVNGTYRARKPGPFERRFAPEGPRRPPPRGGRPVHWDYRKINNSISQSPIKVNLR